MPLEDHIGDICRKARLQTKTDLARCAEVAGLAVEELQVWETEGLIDREVKVAALAELVGLDAGKAVKVADGWGPAERPTPQEASSPYMKCCSVQPKVWEGPNGSKWVKLGFWRSIPRPI